jgi:hypothetical protein
MFDVIVFDETGAPEWSVALIPLSAESAADCLASATAPGAFWHGRDVRIVPAL